MAHPPNALTREMEDRLYELIKAGNYPTIACQAIGLAPSTYAWNLRRGEGRDRSGNPTPDQIRFAQRMREAEALAETDIVQKISASADKDPDMALKFLSRRFRARWAESREVNVNWTIRAIEAIKAGDLTLEDLEAELGTELTEKIRLQIEAPVEGEFTPIEDAVKEEEHVG